MGNPFSKFSVLDREEMIKNGMRSASQAVIAEKVIGTPGEKAQQKEGMRIKYFANYLIDKSRRSIEMPNMNRIPDVYRELADSLFNREMLEDSKKNIKWTISKINALKMQYFKKLNYCRRSNESRVLRKEFYGRAISFVTKQKASYDYLIEASKILRRLPNIKDMPTVIIAGFPNVGKSSLLKMLTGSDPEIQPYPFTTKGLMMGYYDFGFESVQFIDTPGLLDRDIDKRNKIELHAISVIKTIADAVIYVFDPSETCGYNIKEQLNLYEEVKSNLQKPIIAVANKTDVQSKELEIEDMIKISCETGLGLEELRKAVKKSLFHERTSTKPSE